MHGKAMHDSIVLELLAPPEEYGGMIRQLKPNFMDVWSAI